jgi:biopolymer transport protein ExbD
MHFINNKSNKKRIVSLTPLIDVVFILLIFFMLVSNFSRFNAIEINAPAPSSKQNNMVEGSILIRIQENGSIDIAGTPADLKEVTKKIKFALEVNPNQQVIIKPHEKLPIQKVVTLLDTLTETGMTNFSFIK